MNRLQSVRQVTAEWFDRLAFGVLLVLAFSFALEILHPVLTIAGWQFSNLGFLQFLLYGLWVAARVIGLNLRRLPTALTLSIGLWLSVLLLSSRTAPTNSTHVMAFDTQILRGLLIGWIAFDLTRAVRRWQLVVLAFIMGATVVYGLGLAEAAHIQPILKLLEYMRGIAIQAGDLPRISSTLPYPTITAMVIELTLFPAFARLLTANSHRVRLVFVFIILAGIITLILTASRGGLLGLLAGLAVVTVLAWRNSINRRFLLTGSVAALGSLVILIGALALQNPSLLLRFVSENSEAWYRASFSVPDRMMARPGDTLTIPVTLTNTGLHAWSPTGDNPFHLSYHILESFPIFRLGLEFNGLRTPLPGIIEPGQSVSVQAVVPMPKTAGNYVIQWDMVEENVTWFSGQSAPTGTTSVTLVGDPVTIPAEFRLDLFNDRVTSPTATRLALWSAALRMVTDYPWLGVGPDNFRAMYDRYATMPLSDTNVHANSLYIEWLADTGIVGLLAYLLMSLVIISYALRSLSSLSGGPLLIGQIMLIGSLTTWYVHGLVDFFYEFMPTNMGFWLIVGLVVSASLFQKNNIRPAEADRT